MKGQFTISALLASAGILLGLFGSAVGYAINTNDKIAEVEKKNAVVETNLINIDKRLGNIEEMLNKALRK